MWESRCAVVVVAVVVELVFFTAEWGPEPVVRDTNWGCSTNRRRRSFEVIILLAVVTADGKSRRNS